MTVFAPAHRAFEAFARRNPLAPAVSSGERTLTYGELDEHANRLARCLVTRGVGPEVSVAVRLPRSVDAVVAMMAIFKAGGVYVPVDVTHPEALVRRMLDAAAVVVAAEDLRASARESAAALAGHDAASEQAATIFYTSGTTGKPKGVVGTHRNLAHYVHVARDAYRFGPDDVFCALAKTTFAISLFEVLVPLCSGASVRLIAREDVLDPERLAAELDRVTVVHAGPSLLGSLFRHQSGRTFPRVRHASTGGDLVPVPTRAAMTRVFANAECWIIYGCTEASCMATTLRVTPDLPPRTLVGTPFPGASLRVLDEDGHPVSPGDVGLVHLSGDGVARGYLDAPALTAERFAVSGNERFYSTGDLGRLHDDGTLELLGRRDFQVKIRGVRVELAGIEAAIRALGLAADCAVVANRSDDDVRLAAFLVSPADARLATFRRALAGELPEVMLPSRLVVIDALPLTPNGKVDRKQLEEQALEPVGSTARLDGDAPLERRIAAVFSTVLGGSDVGIDDDFFDLGGHSLLAAVVARDIERIEHRALPPLALFESGTPRALAQRLGARGLDASRPILLNGRTGHPPLFALSGVHGYRPLARRLEGRCSVFGVVTAREIEDSLRFDQTRSVDALAREYVAIIRRERPRGPYRLLGYSFAGIVAYEAAQQLRGAGEEVELLALVDSQLPEWALGPSHRLTQLRRLAGVPKRALVAYAARKAFEAVVAPRAQGDAILRLEARRDAVNERAAVAYARRMGSYDGSVVLFSSRGRLRGNPANTADAGWRAHVAALEIEMVDADHVRMLRDEPHVSFVADVLARHWNTFQDRALLR